MEKVRIIQAGGMCVIYRSLIRSCFFLNQDRSEDVVCMGGRQTDILTDE